MPWFVSCLLFVHATTHLIIKAIHTQALLPSIQNTRSITYAGAWTRYGFHEDGFTSGLLAVANHLPGVREPFEIVLKDVVPQKVWVADVFGWLEGSGMSRWLCVWLGLVLNCIRSVFKLVVDLRHLD
jgi:hypothetical protein